LKQRFERFLRRSPRLGRDVFIARTATVLGDVTLGDRASVWYGAVLRGDINRIVVGAETNIQDNAVVHVADEFACVIGERVTVGHSAIVHACHVGDEVLVGMGAIVLDGAVVGDQSIIGAQALVPQGMDIPSGSLVLGAPARMVRKLNRRERLGIRKLAAKYVAYAAYCLAHKLHLGAPLDA
jgi:carbonic anhydrase/acetyltransferase-like protein (isoleucine patch superfamily)